MAVIKLKFFFFVFTGFFVLLLFSLTYKYPTFKIATEIQNQTYSRPVFKRDAVRLNFQLPAAVSLLKRNGTLVSHTEDLDLKTSACDWRPNNNVWDRSEYLDPYNRILMKWNFTDQEIIVEVTGATSGYIGIGFTSNGRMEGADIALMWVDNGKAYVQDHFGISNSRPPRDVHQDFELLFGCENISHTVVAFKRKLNTCDKQDYVISTSTVRVIWALNDEDPLENKENTFSYHGHFRGFVKLNLMTLSYSKPTTEDIEHFDLVIPNVKLSYFGMNVLSFMWYCRFFKIPDFGRKHHMVGFEPLVQHKDLVHHILVYECHSSNPDESFADDDGHYCFLPQIVHRELLCRKVIISQGVGSKGDFYPSHTGYPFGSSEGKPMYLLMQTHYNLNASIKSPLDSSGIRVFHTHKVRSNDLSTIMMLVRAMQFVPPKQTDFPNVGICTSSCTSKFPKEGIRIVRYIFHAHKAISKYHVYHFRNGVEINRVTDENIDFSYQQARYYREELHILPNDTVAVECVYNTINRTLTTVTGPDSNDEMCLLIVQYYPPTNLTFCETVLKSEEVEKRLETPEAPEKLLAFAAQNTNVVGVVLGGLIVKWLSYTWTQEKVKIARDLYLEGPHVPQCINDTMPLAHETNDIVRFSDFIQREPKDTCNYI